MSKRKNQKSLKKSMKSFKEEKRFCTDDKE